MQYLNFFQILYTYSIKHNVTASSQTVWIGTIIKFMFSLRPFRHASASALVSNESAIVVVSSLKFDFSTVSRTVVVLNVSSAFARTSRNRISDENCAKSRRSRRAGSASNKYNVRVRVMQQSGFLTEDSRR